MEKIAVSVIVPVYNVAEYLDRSLTRLTEQTLKNIEIICINDKSSDNSLEILNKYARQDNRIKVIDLEQNSGAAVARNRGLEIAKGEYLGFMDPDDDIDSDFFEKLYNKACENNSDIVKGARKVISSDNDTATSDYNDWLREKGRYFCQMEWTTAIYKNSMVKENGINFPDEIIKGQDGIFLARCIVVSNNMDIIDDTYYYYFKRENSLHTSELVEMPENKVRSAISAYCYILDAYHTHRIFEKDKEAYIRVFFNKLTNTLKYSMRNKSDDIKNFAAETAIKIYNLCEYKQDIINPIKNKKIANLIVNGEQEKLANELKKYKDKYKLLGNDGRFLEKIFSIKNVQFDYFAYKRITILGMKFHIKKKIK